MFAISRSLIYIRGFSMECLDLAGMGQLAVSEGREFMDLLKIVSHAETLSITLCWAIGRWQYRYRREQPSAGTGKLAPLGAGFIYPLRRHRSFGMRSQGSHRPGKKTHGGRRRIREWPGRRYHPGYSWTRSYGRAILVECGTLPSSRMGLWHFAQKINLLVRLKRSSTHLRIHRVLPYAPNASSWLISVHTDWASPLGQSCA